MKIQPNPIEGENLASSIKKISTNEVFTPDVSLLPTKAVESELSLDEKAHIRNISQSPFYASIRWISPTI